MVPDAEERDTEDQPVWSRVRFTDSAPPWVLNKLRQEHVSLWKTYSSGVLRLLLQNRIICRIRYKHNAVSSCCCLQAHGFAAFRQGASAASDD